MSKIFSEIHQLPGNSGKSSTASGMTRYAVNKTFTKGATMPQSTISKARVYGARIRADRGSAKPSRVEVRTEYYDPSTSVASAPLPVNYDDASSRTGRRVNPLRAKQRRVELNRLKPKMPDDYADVSSFGPPTSPDDVPALPPSLTSPTKAVAPAAVDVEVPQYVRNLAELAGEIARWNSDRKSANLSSAATKNRKVAADKFLQARKQRVESDALTEQANKQAKNTVDFIVRHHRTGKVLIPASIGAGILFNSYFNNDDDKKSKPSSEKSWWGGDEKPSMVVTPEVVSVPLVADENKSKTKSALRVNPAFYNALAVKLQEGEKRKQQNQKDIKRFFELTRDGYTASKTKIPKKPSSTDFPQKSTEFSGPVTQKRMIQKGISKSSSDKNSLDSIVDFINQYITPNTNLARKSTDFVSQKTKQYAPVVSEKIDAGVKYGDKAWRESKPLREQAMREGKKFADASVESARNSYGNVLNLGKQFVDLAMSESAKGLGGRSRPVNLKIPKSDYLDEIDLSFSIPTMNELHERAKTVGARKQTGRYDESNEIERALQFVRDWGEENLPTPKKEIKGLPKDFQNKRGRVKVQDGELVPYWQGVDMGTKEPKNQVRREDVVYSGLPVKSNKTKTQEWSTATMKPKGSWKPQAKVEEKFVYNPQLKRYVSTRAKDSNDITEFERYNDGKSVKKGKSMRKSVSSMRSAGVRHVVGGYRGGKAMMKALHKADSMRNPAYVSLPKGSSDNFGNYKMPKSTPTPTPTSTPKSTTPPYISYNASGYKSPYSNFMNPFNPPMSKSMRKSVSSMRSAGVRHVVGGYRGGKAMMKSLYKAFGQMPSSGGMSNGGVFTPMPKPPRPRPPGQMSSSGGIKPPANSGGFTPMGKRMMKSVSSMRSAGTRHLVGGYRGGSKLHKAATPTLATRNFRGKFE